MSKSLMIKFLIVMAAVLAGVFGFYRSSSYLNTEILPVASISHTIPVLEEEKIVATSTVRDVIPEEKNASTTATITPPPKSLIVQNVPFSPQAPFAEWSDIRQEDGCEEMSAIMAMRWVNKQTLSRDEALKALIDITDFETKNYGYNQDSSAADTVERIFNTYFKYKNVLVKNNITTADIIRELEQGHIVIVPVNGKAIGNPNYKNGGPERHNILIKGYDRNTKEFITNDPGTRKGENYRYNEKVMFDSLRDYPSGIGVPITTIEKNMIVIRK